MAGKNEQVGSASDMQWLDPTGQFAGQQANLGNQNNQIMAGMGQYGAGGNAFDPNAYMNQFLGQSAGLSNLVSGQNAPLQQSLNALAAQQASAGGEAALAAMPGAANSGAGMAAFGQAYATPFAQAQAQLQQNQLQGTLGLWNQAMGGNLQSRQGLQNLFGNTQGLQTNMAGQQGMVYQPTYEYKPGLFDYVTQGLGTVASFLPWNWGGGGGGGGNAAKQNGQ